jgi:hypothetical protein
MRRRRMRHERLTARGSLWLMNVIHKEVLGRRLDFDQGPGYYGELLAYRSARVGARPVAEVWHVNMGILRNGNTRVRNNTTSCLSLQPLHCSTPASADQTHMDHVCWACDCLSGTAVPAHPQAVPVVTAQAIHGSSSRHCVCNSTQQQLVDRHD